MGSIYYYLRTELLLALKANSQIPCRSHADTHAVLLPCRAVKGLYYVFSI
jgi:hypothetical protein